jgi:hypothetical protein
VFIIHGDGNYLYHDRLGNPLRADEEALAKAQAIAQRNPDAEVFIFHEIKRRHVLFIFPRRDGRAYYYRHGRLMVQELYWRDQGASRFDPEVEFYGRFAAGERPSPVRMFLYFGHELPEFNGAGYDASHQKRAFTVGDLAEGVSSIVGVSEKVDLLVLGTCFGGTPHTVGALTPYARYIVASPDNLHLSYFDLSPLAALDISAGDAAMATFADRFAANAFQQLESQVQTAVSVVVYDAKAVESYIGSVVRTYDRTLSLAARMSPAGVTHCDCAEDSAYVRPDMSNGLTVYYRAARFGRAKRKAHHSGWECWRLAE